MVDIKHIEEERLQILEVNGEVDASSSIHLDNAMRESIDRKKDIIVDLNGLEYISSAGLGVFMSYLQEMETKGLGFVLFGLNEKVLETFEILGLDQLLVIKKNIEEAREQLNAA